MMKIVAIDTYPLILPVKEIYGGAAGFLEDCRSLIVRVEMENGIEGWGEGTQGRPGNTYETLETMEIMGSLRPPDRKSGHRDGTLRCLGQIVSGAALSLFRRTLSTRD